eukprot:2223583-Alexandrium_andersonii.AAC.1
MVLSRAWNRQKLETSIFNAQPWGRRAKHGATRAGTRGWGPPALADSGLLQRTIQALGEAQTAAFSGVALAADSISA